MDSTSLKSVYKLEHTWLSFLTTHQIQVTSNGKYVFCMCSEIVNLIEVEQGGKIIYQIEIEDDEILDIVLSPDDEFLIIALKSGSLKVYDCSDIPKVPIFLKGFKSFHRGPMSAMAVSSELLVTGSADGVVRVWDLQKTFCTHRMDTTSGVVSTIKIDNDLQSRPWLYVSADTNIYIWRLNLGSSELVAKLSEHYSKVTDMQIHHNRKQLISCGLDKVIIVWSLETFKAEKIIPVYESISVMVLKPENIQFLQVSKDKDSYVLLIGDKGFPCIWNVTKGKREWVNDKQIAYMPDTEGVTVVEKMQLVPALESLVITTYERSILFIKYQTMEVWKQLAGHHDQVLDLIFCGDEDTHLIVATNSGQLSVFDRQSGNCCLVAGHKSSVMSLSCHPTLKHIFGSSSNDNTARLWNLNGGSPICIYTALTHTHSITCLALSENYFITASKDMCVKSWKLPKEKLKNCLKAIDVTLQNSVQGHSLDINCVSVAINGNVIATGSEDKTVKIWNSELCEMGILRGHKRAIWCIKFSPIDRIVATASSDTTIKLWSLSDFTLIKSFEDHSKAVLQILWVSSGKHILSTGADASMKVWSVKEGTCLHTVEGHEGEIWSLAASDKTVVTGGEDATIYWWKDVTEEEELHKQEELASLAEDEQKLQNFVKSKKWKKALVLSIRLNKPYHTRAILVDLIAESPDAIPEVLNQLKNDNLSSVLEYAQSWITQKRNLKVARTVIKYFLTEKTPEEFEEIRGCMNAVAGLLPYSERHAKRTAAHQTSSQIYDFAVYEISLK